MKKVNNYTIDNWSIHHLEGEKFVIPILVGDIDGQEVKTDTIFWLDTANNVAMTKKDIYQLGRPHAIWYSNLVSSGYQLKDMDIKGTNH